MPAPPDATAFLKCQVPYSYGRLSFLLHILTSTMLVASASDEKMC